MGVLQHRKGLPNAALIGGIPGKAFQRGDLLLLVSQRTGPKDVLLVQRSGPVEISEFAIRPREAEGCLHRVVMIADLAEQPDTLFEDPPRLVEILRVVGGDADQ